MGMPAPLRPTREPVCPCGACNRPPKVSTAHPRACASLSPHRRLPPRVCRPPARRRSTGPHAALRHALLPLSRTAEPHPCCLAAQKCHCQSAPCTSCHARCAAEPPHPARRSAAHCNAHRPSHSPAPKPHRVHFAAPLSHCHCRSPPHCMPTALDAAGALSDSGPQRYPCPLRHPRCRSLQCCTRPRCSPFGASDDDQHPVVVPCASVCHELLWVSEGEGA